MIDTYFSVLSFLLNDEKIYFSFHRVTYKDRQTWVFPTLTQMFYIIFIYITMIDGLFCLIKIETVLKCNKYVH